MMKRDLKPIFGMFIVIVIGVAFMLTISNSLSPSTLIQSVSSESHSIATARVGTLNNINESKTFAVTNTPALTSNLPISNFVLKNATGSSATATTDYVVNVTDGTYTLKNTTFWVNQVSNSSSVDYSYYSSNYVKDAGTNSVLSLIPFLTALGLLLCVIGYLNWEKIEEYFGV